MNFRWLGPLALLAVLVIADQIRINRPGHKYRLTVEVETPEGVKSASGILAVQPDRGYSRSGHTRTLGDAVLLDLGGGSGAFSIEAVKRYPGLSAVVFDLPQVVAVTEQIIQETGLTSRITCAGGDLRIDPWPAGADLILLSYIVSCYEPQTLRALLARTQAYLPSGGRLLIHDFALSADRSGPHNAALFLFGQLSVSAQTQAYIVDELGAAMQEAGYVDVVMQPFLPDLTFLLSGRKP